MQVGRRSAVPALLVFMLVAACGQAGETGETEGAAPTAAQSPATQPATADATATQEAAAPSAAPASGCPGQTASGSPSAAELAMDPSPEREELLAERAKANGEPVLVYTSGRPEEMDEITSGFTEKYGVQTEVFRAGGTDLLSRVIQEVQANEPTADVIAANDNVIYGLDAGEGILSPIVSVYDDAIPDQIVASPNSVPNYVNYWMFAYNTELLEEGELPRTYEELLDPRWQGAISIARYPDWFATLWDILGEEAAEEYFTALGDQKPFVADQFTPAIMAVVTGAQPLTSTTVSGVLAQQQDAGAPLEGYFPDEPTIARSQSSGWVDCGGNPEGGILFLEYLQSPEGGQQVYKDANRVPAHEDVEPDPPTLRPDEFVRIDYESYLPEQAEWEQRFDEMLINQ